jgi:hypothetical protein
MKANLIFLILIFAFVEAVPTWIWSTPYTSNHQLVGLDNSYSTGNPAVYVANYSKSLKIFFIKFHLDNSIGETTISVLQKSTGQIIRQFPIAGPYIYTSYNALSTTILVANFTVVDNVGTWTFYTYASYGKMIAQFSFSAMYDSNPYIYSDTVIGYTQISASTCSLYEFYSLNSGQPSTINITANCSKNQSIYSNFCRPENRFHCVYI